MKTRVLPGDLFCPVQGVSHQPAVYPTAPRRHTGGSVLCMALGATPAGQHWQPVVESPTLPWMSRELGLCFTQRTWHCMSELPSRPSSYCKKWVLQSCLEEEHYILLFLKPEASWVGSWVGDARMQIPKPLCCGCRGSSNCRWWQVM